LEEAIIVSVSYMAEMLFSAPVLSSGGVVHT
jgi:hypothetical protein